MRTLKRLVACVAVVAAVAGCAAAGTTTPKVSGGTLTVYASAPNSAASQYADVIAAERLAYARAPHSLDHFHLRLRVVHGLASDNARTAIEDSSAIAYIGELAPGASEDSVGVTNAEDLLQVSPTDTALELTHVTPAVRAAPGEYYESLKSYGRTFARVVPTSAAEARAQAMEMRSLGVKKVYVTDDGSPYGRAIAYAVSHDVSAPVTAVQGPPSASRVSASGADAVFFGGTNTKVARALFDAVAAKSITLKCAGRAPFCGWALLAPSALYSNRFVQALSPAARGNLYVSSPGFLARDLPSAARSQFLAPFEAAYHHAPDPQAIFGYEAVSAVLLVLHQAGADVNQRDIVVRDFMDLRRRSSVLGSYSIDRYGEPTTAPFVFARVKGAALQPYRFEQASG